MQHLVWWCNGKYLALAPQTFAANTHEVSKWCVCVCDALCIYGGAKTNICNYIAPHTFTVDAHEVHAKCCGCTHVVSGVLWVYLGI